MKLLAAAIFGWLVPGGAYLMARRYLQFGLTLALVGSATLAGVALGGANLWPGAGSLDGLDGMTAMVAKAGALARLMAGAPYFLARLAHYSVSFLNGETHEYGTTLLILAGLINLLALADALELRKAHTA